MQIKADFTEKDLMEHADPLFEACHPLGRIKMLADMLYFMDKGELTTGNVINHENMLYLSDLLKDAAGEIEYLIDISNKQWHRDREKWTGARLPMFMEDLARQMDQDPADWDFKAAARNIRYVLSQ